MRFKDFIAKVDPQPRPKPKLKDLWVPGALYRRSNVRPYEAVVHHIYPSTIYSGRLIVVATDGRSSWKDQCELTQ